MPARGDAASRRQFRLLILGGSAEAAALARETAARFGADLHVITSLAGGTERPGPLAGTVRIGGFGGAEGLAKFLADERIDILIDATHPFADRMARNARLAAERAQVPRLVLERPPWRRDPLDRWIEVDNLDGAAQTVARLGRRCFLTVGSGELAPFAAIDAVHFVVRLIEPPPAPLPLKSYEVVLGRGPFTLAAERELLRRYWIDVVVAKADGGAATEAKLIAAREANLPVIMVRRPPQEPGTRVGAVEAALDWLKARLAEAAARRTAPVAS